MSQLATLNWNAVLDATYNVYFGTNNPPTDIVNGTNQSGTSYTPAAILNPTTTYYWRIEPKNSLNNTASCSTWSFTTQAAAPSISATALTSFSACVGSLSNANTFVINGINLTGTNITITAPTNCTISEDDINYYSSIDVNHSSGTISNKTIYVKLTPSAEGAYSDNIVISNGGLSTNVNVAVTGTGNRVFNGTYTVGSSGAYDYPTLTAAVTAYNNIQCITGDVVFRLMDANYSSAETFPIVINNISNDANYTLTIRPATTATIINSSNLTASAIIKINDVHHIIIDGSNNGTTSKDLTITNNNSTTTSAAIWIGSSVYGAYNIIVKNCNISGNNANTTVAGVIAGSNITMGDAAGAPNSYITIDNNTITAAQNALYYSGEASSHDDHLTVTNNIFGSSVAANRLGYRGMFLGNVDNFLVDGNTINGVYYSGSSSVIGIQLGFLAANGTITKNKIYDIKNSSTLGYGSCGIYLSNTSTTANLNVSNNFISDVASYGYNGVTSADNGNGIFIYSGGGYNIDHNTINLATSQTAANGNPAAINISSNFTTTGGINLRNNIFSIPATVGKRYAIYCGAANTVFNTIDYNDYYSAGTNIGFLGANQATLGAIQTAFGGNLNSKNIAPVFVNAANNLHLIPASNTTLDNLGTPLAAITNDIDLESRSLTTPDMGADEFNSSTLAVSLLSLTGAKEGTRNILRWVTATETNNNGFEVQRSTDGIHYNAIGYVQSLATGGNSSSNLSYLFTDNTFTGTIQYYRLRQVDNDNTSHLSNVVVIREANPVVLSITELYPNPASSFINVVISSPMSDKVTAVITDVLGKTILQKQLAVEKGNNVVSFNIAQLASGTYFVKLTCNNNCPKAVSRFVKK